MIHKFFNEGAWIEGAALTQLDQLAAMPNTQAIAAMPDLHPGKYGPVGTATLSQDLRPLLIGSDIGCGMTLCVLDTKVRKLRLDKAAERLKELDRPWNGDHSAARLAFEIEPTDYDDSWGSIGGGNHFCELQAVHEVLDVEEARKAGLDRDLVHCLIHTGSRGFGYSILTGVIESGKTLYEAGSDDATRYMAAHDHAVRWAEVNRSLIAENVGDELGGDVGYIADLSHNHVQAVEGGFLHRKGAAPADRGLVPIPGSRETLSYLVKPLEGAPIDALMSLAHGAGRKYERGAMHGRVGKTKSAREAMSRNPWGGIIVCEDRQLMIEEAGDAYKNVDRVIADMVAFGLIKVVATFRPLVTFKTGQAHIGSHGDRR